MTPTEVIELSGERDLAMQARLAAYRAGYAAAADIAWSAGYAHAIAEVKAAQHGLVLLVGELAGIEAARWMVRGESRCRQTFSQPHPDDYPGQAGAT